MGAEPPPRCGRLVAAGCGAGGTAATRECAGGRKRNAAGGAGREAGGPSNPPPSSDSPLFASTCSSLPLVFGRSNLGVNLPACVKRIPNPCLTPRILRPPCCRPRSRRRRTRAQPRRPSPLRRRPCRQALPTYIRSAFLHRSVDAQGFFARGVQGASG